MPTDHTLLTDKAYLTGVQYRTDANLAARQSIYAYQQPRIELAVAVLDLAKLASTETIADIGCGNGMYLAELTRRGHPGLLIGADLSPGMLAAARSRTTGAALVIGDAAALPLPDAVADVTLAPHMLYHVPDRPAAVREFRRITRPACGPPRLCQTRLKPSAPVPVPAPTQPSGTRPMAAASSAAQTSWSVSRCRRRARQAAIPCCPPFPSAARHGLSRSHRS